jgi:hypothetical protein
MVFSKIEIVNGVLHTSNDSYPLTPNTTFSAPRPFRAMGIVTALMISAFGVAFSDLLFWNELGIVTLSAAACFFLGNTIAHLLIVNSDLRGSDLSVAAWGTYRHLNQVRRELADAARAPRSEVLS